MTSDVRRPLIDDDLIWKTSLNGRRPRLEDDLVRMESFAVSLPLKQPSIFLKTSWRFPWNIPQYFMYPWNTHETFSKHFRIFDETPSRVSSSTLKIPVKHSWNFLVSHSLNILVLGSLMSYDHDCVHITFFVFLLKLFNIFKFKFIHNFPWHKEWIRILFTLFFFVFIEIPIFAVYLLQDLFALK